MSKQEITTKLAATEASLKRWQTRLKRAAKMVHDLDRKRRRYQLMLLSEGQPVIATVKVKNGKVESPLPELVQAIDNRLTAIIEDRPALDMPAFLDRSDPLIAEKMTAARKAAEAEARKAMPLSGRAAALAIKLAKKKKA